MLLPGIGEGVQNNGNVNGLSDDAFTAAASDGGGYFDLRLGSTSDASGTFGNGSGLCGVYDDAYEGFFKFQLQRLLEFQNVLYLSGGLRNYRIYHL